MSKKAWPSGGPGGVITGAEGKMNEYDYTGIRQHLLSASSSAVVFQRRAGRINLEPSRHPQDISASDVADLRDLVVQIIEELNAIDSECVKLARKGLEVVK